MRPMRREDGAVTLRRIRRHARLGSAGLVIALVVLVASTCLAAAESTSSPHACCAAMDDGCGEPELASACCEGAADSVQGIAVEKGSDRLTLLACTPAQAPGAVLADVAAASRLFPVQAACSPPGTHVSRLGSSLRI